MIKRSEVIRSYAISVIFRSPGLDSSRCLLMNGSFSKEYVYF